MRLRFPAVLASAVVAIGLGACSPGGAPEAGASTPAANVTAYKAMILVDHNSILDGINATFNSTNQCDSVQNAGCPVALKVMIPKWQSWLTDLDSFQTPSAYALIDRQLRLHLIEEVAELTAVVSFQHAQNEIGFDRAIRASSYELAWFDPTVSAIEGTYPRLAGSYHDAVSLTKRALDACVNSTPGPGELGCYGLSTNETCIGTAAQICASDVQSAETQMQAFMVALLQNPAPGSFANQSARVQTGLAQVDTTLLAISDGLLLGDSKSVSDGQSAYAASILGAHAEVSAAARS